MSGTGSSERLAVIIDGDHATIVCKGNLDYTNANEFVYALSGAIEASRSVTIDLRHVGFIDSTAMREMLIVAREMLKQGRRLVVLAEEEGNPLRAMRMIGCEAILNVAIVRRGDTR